VNEGVPVPIERLPPVPPPQEFNSTSDTTTDVSLHTATFIFFTYGMR